MRYSTYSGHSFLRSIHSKSVPAIPESRYIVSRVTCIQRGKGVSGHPLCNSIDRATFGTHSTPAGKKNFFFFSIANNTRENKYILVDLRASLPIEYLPPILRRSFRDREGNFYQNQKERERNCITITLVSATQIYSRRIINFSKINHDVCSKKIQKKRYPSLLHEYQINFNSSDKQRSSRNNFLRYPRWRKLAPNRLSQRCRSTTSSLIFDAIVF